MAALTQTPLSEVQAAAALAELDKMAFDMYVDTGRSYAETARQMGVAVSTIRDRVRRHSLRSAAENAAERAACAAAAAALEDGRDPGQAAADAANDAIEASAGPGKVSECVRCGFVFPRPQSRQVCKSEAACEKRQAANQQAA